MNDESTAPGVARINGVPARLGLDTKLAENDIVEIQGLGKFVAYHEDGIAKLRPVQ